MNVVSFQPHQAVSPASLTKKPRLREVQHLPKDPTTRRWDFSLLELLAREKKKYLGLLPSDSLFPHTDIKTHTFLPPRMPLLLPRSAAPHGGWALEGTGRGKEPKQATERKRAWAGGLVRQQPGPGCVLPKLGAQKLLLFTPQLCPSGRQRRACPGLGLGFSTSQALTRSGPGTNMACPVRWGAEGARHCHLCPLCPES